MVNDLDPVLRRDSRVVYVVVGGGVLHLTTRCKRLKNKSYKQLTLLTVKSQCSNPKVCSDCKKNISRKVTKK